MTLIISPKNPANVDERTALSQFTTSFSRFIEIASDYIEARLAQDFETSPFFVSLPLTEYRLLGAFYVQKEKHARLMDEHGILRRDEIDLSLVFSMLKEKYDYEMLFTLSPRENEYCLYNKKTQEIELYDLPTKERVKSYPFPLAEDQCIDIDQESNLHLQSIFNPNYLLVTVTTLDKNGTMNSARKACNLWVLNLETGERRKVTTPLDEKRAKVEQQKQEAIAKLEAVRDQFILDPPTVDHLNRDIANLKANFGKTLGFEYYTLASYPMDLQRPVDEVIYFFQDYPLDEKTKSITGNPISKVLAYNLVSGKTRTLGNFEILVTHVELSKDLKVSSLQSHVNKEFKVYKLDKRGVPEIRLSLSAEEREFVTPWSYDENHVLLMDARFTDKKTPVLKSLVRNMEMPLLSEEEETILKSDVKNVIIHPKTKELLAYETYYDKSRLHIKTSDGHFESFAEEDFLNEERRVYGLELLQNLRIQAGVNIKSAFSLEYTTDRSIKDVVLSTNPQTGEIRLEEVASRKKASDLNPLTRSKFAKTEPFTFKARDGLEIQAYLTLPQNIETHENLPTVLLIHGGPMARDKFEMTPDSRQFWASRGCAVVQINFRGSKGFGKEFLKSAWGDWHGKMTDDLIDGLDQLIKQGIVDKGRIIATGASYGGFATASLLTKYPDYFQCGVAINGTFDLVEDFKAAMEKKTIHTPQNEAMQLGADLRLTDQYEEEEAKLKIQSPFNFVPNMTKPLLLITGSKDNNYLPSQSADFASMAKKWGKSVTHVEFKDEEHSFSLGNLPHLMGVQENFVAQYVPGIYAEPMDREMKQNPAIKVKTSSRY